MTVHHLNCATCERLRGELDSARASAAYHASLLRQERAIRRRAEDEARRLQGLLARAQARQRHANNPAVLEMSDELARRLARG